jgi:hypothetical protein
MADISYYLSRITSAHVSKAKFKATVAALVQPLADTTLRVAHFYQDYDIDQAIGAQLDAVGIWVGRSRFLPVPIDAYFTLDRVGFGLDEAVWKRPFDPDVGLVELPDEAYRTLLHAVIAANHWDGTIPGAYAAWETIFTGTPYKILLQDYGNGEMGQALISAKPPDQITLGLFNTGELDLKPAGIRLWHILPITYPAGPGGTPLFGLDSDNPTVGGLDVGAWAKFFAPE